MLLFCWLWIDSARYFVVYRALQLADLAGIKVGSNTHIKDNVVVHIDSTIPTVIGDSVVIGTPFFRPSLF